jgi:YegS/Rv2252/BmrU family lipid kinase
MHIVLIANPVAGGDARARIERARTWFAANAAVVELVLTGSAGDARRAATALRNGGCDRVVVAGGDGTLNEVINGLAPSPIPVAFLPLGTTNVFALEAGIPRDIDQACRVALQGTPRPVCLGRADGERFLLMASAGFDAAVVHRVDLAWKRKTGKLAYFTSALTALRQVPLTDFEVIGDDGLVRSACQMVASNARFYGGRFSLTPTASLFAERLDVCLVRPMGKVALLSAALLLAAGLTPPGVERFTTRALALRGAPVPLQLDGDPQGTLPRTLTVTAGEIVLVLPR